MNLEIQIFEFDFLTTRGHQKNFRCDFWNLHSRNRGIRFEILKNLKNSSKSVVHDDPYPYSNYKVISGA